jgi:hypothetical protein
MNLRDLQVRKGDPILPAWKRLLAWAKQFRLEAGKGIRLTRTPNGTYIIAEPPPLSWEHPFKAAVSDDLARLLPGTLNQQIPVVQGRPLDGDPAPALRLREGPNGDLRSWITLEAEVNGESGLTDPGASNAIRIVHSREAPSSAGLIGRHALAMLVWSADRASVQRVHQITHFNLQHRFARGAPGRSGRHFFWPA